MEQTEEFMLMIVQSMDSTEADKTWLTDIGFCILSQLSVGKPFSHPLFHTTQNIQ